ncbi:MAG TPA: hypothetical protein VIS27_09535 [Yeosuana sp.]
MAWTPQQIQTARNEGRPAEANRMEAQNTAEYGNSPEAKAAKNKSNVETISENFKEGQNLANTIIGTGTLGSVNEKLGKAEGRLQEGRSADVQSIIEMRRKNLGGLTAEEKSAQSGKAAEQFGRNEETNRRRLSGVQASLGVRGATAATQQSAQLGAGQQQRTNFERDMILANRQIQEQSLSAFEASVRGAEGSEQAARSGNIQIEQFNLGQQLKERELEQFNLQQRAKERFGQVAVAMGITQLASADDAAQRASAAQVAAAAAAGSGGK